MELPHRHDEPLQHPIESSPSTGDAKSSYRSVSILSPSCFDVVRCSLGHILAVYSRR